MKSEAKLNQEFQKIIDSLKGVMDLCESKEYVLGFLMYRHLSERFESWWEKHKDKGLYDTDCEGRANNQTSKRKPDGFIKQEYLFSGMLKKASQYEDLHQELKNAFSEIEATNLDILANKGPLTSMDLINDQLGKDIYERNKTIIEIMSAVSLLDLSAFTFEEIYKEMICKYISLESEGLMPNEVSRLLVELTESNGKKTPLKNYELYPIKSVFQKTIVRDRACLGWINFALVDPGYEDDISDFPLHAYRDAFICIYDEEVLSQKEYQKFRFNLIAKNMLDTVILLPQELFKDSDKSRCIIIMKEPGYSNIRSKALFIDASGVLIGKQGTNKSMEKRIQTIANYYKNKDNVDNYSCLVGHDEISEREYDFSVREYVSRNK